ncbi:hypothetical protein VB264_23735 [Arcicella aquatica]|uniref:Uncharacterized protein n=1 Tax=Arcicella aquatica TaxID=217141 RepID=A0ABU5QUN9_9BACT|nr:hypothetical protein [Arcicella aquatica]MEA5260832.1 hypothetical protein [Arcicella aquatica]
MKKKLLKITVLIVLAMWGFYTLGSLFAPGSYPNAEVYEIEMSDSLLIERIKKFKINNPSYDIPSATGLTDDVLGQEDKWIMCYFYYQKENQIVQTWVRKFNNTSCQFAIVSINDGMEIGKWKDLNHDYGFFETIKERDKFEERILKPLKVNFKRTSIF